VTVSLSQVAPGRRWPRPGRAAAAAGPAGTVTAGVPGQRTGGEELASPPAAGGPLLQIRDLAVAIPTESGTIEAVRGLSLAVSRGETIGVVGESGSGKTMLALSILGLQPRTARVSGSVQLEAPSSSAAARRSGTGSGAPGSRWSSRIR
jgi:ABC-type uncharacterized transport system ATPase subunit